MLLADPQPSRFDLQFSLGPIPVRVHPTFWLITGIFGLMQAMRLPLGHMPVFLSLWLAAAFIAILVHELGHALFARLYGWAAKVIIYGMGGLAVYPMTGQHRISSRITIALAGPGAGFLLGGIVLALVVAFGYQVNLPGLPITVGEGVPILGNLGVFVNSILLISIFWGFINLAPVPPLDGGTVALCLFQKYSPGRAHERSAQLGMATCIAVIIGAIVLYKSIFLAMMFGILGYQCYQSLQFRR